MKKYDFIVYIIGILFSIIAIAIIILIDMKINEGIYGDPFCGFKHCVTVMENQNEH